MTAAERVYLGAHDCGKHSSKQICVPKTAAKAAAVAAVAMAAAATAVASAATAEAAVLAPTATAATPGTCWHVFWMGSFFMMPFHH